MLANKITSISTRETLQTQYGTIDNINPECGSYIVQCPDGCFNARLAFSCLVKPIPGDTVLISYTDSEACYILSIIERPLSTETTLEFAGDVSINAINGNVNLTGDQGIQFATPEAVSVAATRLQVLADEGLLNVRNSTLSGETLNSHISRLNIFARSIETVAERVSQSVVNSFRLIRGVDQKKAGDVLTTITNLLSIHSRQAAVIAKSDIKIDAERIHMG